jgi:hypothetical protein
MTDTTTGATTELIQGLRDIQQSISNVVAEMLADPRLNQGNAYNPVGGERGMIELAGQWIPEAIAALAQHAGATTEKEIAVIAGRINANKWASIPDILRPIFAERDRLRAERDEARAMRWIPCSERMPELFTTVLVAGGIAQWDGEAWFTLTGSPTHRIECHVTHWMPLPAPPQAEGRKE